MAKIVNLQTYRTKAIEQRAFRPWQERFGGSYGQKSRLSDLSDETLYRLALPGEKNAEPFYELIMGVLNLGLLPKFYYLDKERQVKVVDIHLFLVDQVRFEMMRRLGWIDSFPSQGYALLEMVQSFNRVKDACRGNPPTLTNSHPEYGAYRQLADRDKETFIRRKLPKALETFKVTLGL